MSAQELLARIEEMERQTGDPKQLEHNRVLLRRQLNALRDPVTRLPLEIASEIFVQCLPLEPPRALPAETPALFLGVCNSWSTLVSSIPALWSKIHIEFPCSEDFQAVLERWFKRAGTHPLHIYLDGPLDAAIAAFVWRSSDQLERLEISTAGEAEEEEEEEEGDEEDRELVFRELLAGTQPEALPLLQALKITGCVGVFSRLPILHLLRVSPALADLSFHDLELVDGDDDDEDEVPQEVVVLPELRRLVYGRDKLALSDKYKLLKFISAPLLESFTLEASASHANVTSFLQRSSPPLQELVIGDAGDLEQLEDFLSLTPSVTRLEINWLARTEELFAILAGSPSVLSGLQTLELSYTDRMPVDDSFVRASETRSNQLRRFVLTYRFRLVAANAARASEILGALRGLVASGMDISIGRVDGPQIDLNELVSGQDL
ncbi:hypothetical protein FB45DRAFT_359593 [Roridomyces roridus]|uniref:F-box domain-containing protein n=1 Tax=Roridomyces roridus TaxID=1738132 RepID=A0AAD7C9S7_9AGAR|nr:hypothetical protein FB45DRAFT_359593 [Roridomyces roridus]